MNRFRLGAAPALALSLTLALGAPEVHAAAEVHHLSLVLSAIPTQVGGGDFNDAIQEYNRARFDPRGLEGLKTISFAWLYDAELHYFVRSNVAIGVGVGQLRSQSKREFLPSIQEDITVRAEMLSVPIHVGADYYLAPYNQGDFQARAYLGGGFLSLVDNKALIEQVEIATDSVTSLGGSFRKAVVRDSPGYFLEAGVHMFFAIRYSVMLSVLYRSAQVRGMIDRDTGQPFLRSDGKPFTLDVGGVGARMGLGIGF